MTKNELSSGVETGKSIAQILFDGIEKGKPKAVDRVTNKPIPGKEIFTWHMPVDTVAAFDNSGNANYKLIRKRISPDYFNQLRIYQDWYMDLTTRKLKSVIKWIELLEEVHTPDSGIFIGYRSFCRIYY